MAWTATVFLSILVTVLSAATCAAEDARDILEAAFDYYRGETSYAEVDMTIHRPSWERTMTLEGWSRGRREGLFRVTAPPKDRGNGTLKKGREMWTYSPKVNRVIKIPPSMMSQAWMGSDFSNNDLAKSDTILEDYVAELEGEESHDGRKVHVLKLVPKPHAPVVWGLQRIRVREDHILLRQSFYDEDLELVKEMTASEIVLLGGKLFPRVWVMRQVEVADEYTRLVYRDLEFDLELSSRFFTLANLKDPRER